MIIHANTPVHPLQRPGVQQRERLLQALIPGNLRLDDRSMQELIAFSGKFAEQVRFWNANNQAQGDWTPFWESDVTTLFAMMAAVDLENLRTEYRSLELQYLRLLKAELENPDSIKSEPPTAASTIREMVVLIYKLALKVAEFCQKAPAEHPLHHEYQRIVSTQLQAPLKALIAFHKGSKDKILLDEYAAFIGNGRAAGAWGLPTSEDFLCIDFVLPDESREELWRLFLQFYRALALMADKAGRAFRSALRSRDDHAPHITLFLTFLHLFRHLQDEMNRLPERHLQFYYEDVLRLEQRRVIPDKVHVVFELAQGLERYRLKKDTLFGGGTDQSGKLRVYGLEDEVAVGKVKLVERKNFYFKENDQESLFSIALPAADKRDGIEEDFKPGEKAWNAFSGYSVYERLLYRFNKITNLVSSFHKLPPSPYITKEKEILEKKFDALTGFAGWIISSPELWLENGAIRVIQLRVGKSENFTTVLNEFTKVELFTQNGWENIPVIKIEEESPSIPNVYLNRAVFYSNGLHIVLDPDSFDLRYTKETRIPLLKLGVKQGWNAQMDVNIQGINIKSQRVFSRRLNSIEKPRIPNKILLKFNERIYKEEESLIIENSSEVYVYFEEIFRKQVKGLAVELLGANYQEGWDINFSIKSGDGNWNKINNIEQLQGIDKPFNAPSETFNEEDIGIIKITFTKEDKAAPIILSAQDIGIYYETREQTPQPRYITSLGELPVTVPGDGFRLFPTFKQPSAQQLLSAATVSQMPLPEAHGNLFLGFESLLPNQTLNLLFKMAEGSGNPDHLAPEVIWSYLRDNDWVRFPPQFILKDETKGMKQTGIIRFQIPEDINNGNTWIKGKEDRTDLFWLRASATEFPDDKILVDALPMLVDIHVNAGTAVFQDDGNSPEHLEPGLPAETINALRFRDVHVKRVEQPYTSFGGRLSEAGDRHAYYRRIHERLRHRQRAVSAWDYERLVLEEFPKVALAKCLTHTQVVAAGMPGHVTLAVVPYPDKMTGDRRYYPNLDAGDLEAMRRYLSRHNSYFVGGYGSPGFCGCHDEEHAAAGSHECHCGCGHDHSRLSVINARFEPVRLQVCVRFHAGKDIPYYTKQLNEDLKTFLAPWATDQHKPLLFGTSLSTTNLLLFLENLDYVDVVMNLKIKHFASRTSADYGEGELPWSAPDTIVPLTAASLLTTYLNRLDEDNPNVLDHEINVIADQDGCACKTCLSEEVRLLIETEWRKNPSLGMRVVIENVIKENIKRAMQEFVFEPNTPDTWNKAKSKIVSFLNLLWVARILNGKTPDNAFCVNVGIGETMTEEDVNNGKMIIEIGASIRPENNFSSFTVETQLMPPR